MPEKPRTRRVTPAQGLLRRLQDRLPGALSAPGDRADAGPPGPNPLYSDSELFYEYMKLLDDVLEQPEIRSGLSDQNLSPTTMRMTCVSGAKDVLREAVAEYTAYELALAGYREALVEGRRPGNRDAGDHALRLLSVLLGVTGAVAIVVGSVAGRWWGPVAFLWKPGLAALAVGVLAFTMALVRMTEAGVRLLGGEITGVRGGELDRARRILLDTVRAQHLLAFVRTKINEARRSTLGEGFMVTASPGLSEVNDSAYDVPTEITAEMDELAGRLAGGSIGVAGPRGSGKSTLVRGYCEDPGYGSGDLRCMVAAPVDYAARDFILHLFATFCRCVRAQVGRSWDDADDEPPYVRWATGLTEMALSLSLWSGALLLLFRHRVAAVVDRPASLVVYAGLGVAAYGFLGMAARATLTLPGGRERFAEVCTGAALNTLRPALRWGAVGAGLLYFRGDIAGRLGRSPRLVEYGAWAVIAVGALSVRATFARERRRVLGGRAMALRRLMAAAGRNLERVRYLQTSSFGWSGGLKLPFGTEGSRTRGVSRAEQPMSYPEIVDEFRAFAAEVAAFLDEDGNRVFIGVDELDKIGSAEQAERFLNEIKGVFGIPHTYFLVSVSDDALTSFERRGLPLRDAFDSSFDEIVRADPLTYLESRRLIYRRVIGLTEPYVAFCHCLSGGLARDLIRAARQVVRAGQHGVEPRGSGEICATILGEEVRRKLTATAQVIAAMEGAEQAGPLLERLFAITHTPSAVRPTLGLLKEIGAAGPSEPAPLVAVHRDLTAYLYFCATLQDVFGQRVEESVLLWATADGDRHPGHLDTLATVRLTLGHSAHVAWQLVDGLRDAWSFPRAEI
ncbi:hypothetical protein [Actinomadura sp. DC4]|uniref:hypothetical protein n=1 Tax=Actinomadura sp. DC4 TaxID=3055069 RepID=UPI0025AF6334|nr:hypothetical protein [Actinomadura sp. DC4]MDN3357133.1 hypothetical protein [Actinomadura sp. DC4]